MSDLDQSWVSDNAKEDVDYYRWLYRTGFDRTTNTEAKFRYQNHALVVAFLLKVKLVDKNSVDEEHHYHDGLDTTIFKTNEAGFENLIRFKNKIFESLKDFPEIDCIGCWGTFSVDCYVQYSPRHYKQITLTVSDNKLELSTRYVIRDVSAIVDFINRELSFRYKKHHFKLDYDQSSGDWVLNGDTSSLKKFNIHLPSGYDLRVVVGGLNVVNKMVLFKDGWSIKNVKNVYHLFDILLNDDIFNLTVSKIILKQKLNITRLKYYVLNPMERKNIWVIRATNKDD